MSKTIDQLKLRLMQRQRIQRHVLEHQRPATSLLERALWAVARRAPHGGLAIPTDFSNPYLLRLYLTAEGARINLLGKNDLAASSGARPYLHYFFRGDDDEELHNHPWRVSYSLILTGGYTEFRWNPLTKQVDRKVFTPGMINVIKHDDFHRVELLDKKKGCWTLFISIDRLRASDGTDWEFMDVETGQLTPWGEHNARKEAHGTSEVPAREN